MNQVQDYTELTDAHFFKSDSTGKLNIGLKWHFGTETHSTHQFSGGLPELKATIEEFSRVPEISHLQVTMYRVGETREKVLWFRAVKRAA